MPIQLQTIPKLSGPYGGMLQGAEISAQLNSDNHKGRYLTESLNAEMGDLRFSAEPIHGSSGFMLDVYDSNGNMTSNVVFDNNGRVKFVGSKDKNSNEIQSQKINFMG